uniref:Uncharacterized protein n=1 Tax=viral metagenome TaxID=1070528 RepID=A0A6H1ZVT7_9ZZZZ
MGIEFKQISPTIGKYPTQSPVLMYDNMETEFSKITTGNGTDWTIARSQTHVNEGAYSLKLQTKTTTPAIDDYIELTYKIPYTSNKNITVEFLCSSLVATQNATISINITEYTGTTRNVGEMEYNLNTGLTQYKNSMGEIIPTPTQPTKQQSNAWGKFSLHVDLENKQYTNVYANNRKIPLQNTPLLQTTSTAAAIIYVTITLLTTAATQATTYIDNMLIHRSSEVI